MSLIYALSGGSINPIMGGSFKAVNDRSKRVYKGLRKFRAGIESAISWLKRSFGLTRCMWKGFESFKSYVWASIVSANLLTLARKQLA